MPTYEYACPKCGHTFEQYQSMLDEPLKKCPACKKTGVKRLVGGGGGLIFKGSGFYITDYRNKDSAAKEKRKAGTGSKSAETKPAEAKSAEAKPAAASGGSKAAAPAKTASSSKSVGT
jgi:putative FmdB family regulatory protein